MKKIELKHVKIIIGWKELIKYKFDNYLGSFNRRQTAVFEKGKKVYIFDPLGADEYTFSEEGMEVEKYYGKPDYMEAKYRLTVTPDHYSNDKFDRLHRMKILTDEMYAELKKNNKEHQIAYAKTCIAQHKQQITYLEGIIKENESDN